MDMRINEFIIKMYIYIHVNKYSYPDTYIVACIDIQIYTT